ncbi:MAG: hypothetical protein RLZZ324_1009 [Candidatus Parcubacteria bacterium]|jgi:PAS domain S-box-containing protein
MRNASAVARMFELTNQRLVRSFRLTAQTLIVFALLIAASSLAGYALEAGAVRVASALSFPVEAVHAIAATLRSGWSGLQVGMNPATALLFLLSGAALLIGDRSEGVRRRTSLVLAALVALLGTIKMIGVLTGHDVWFDHALFSGQMSAESILTGRANQLAPNTAFAFMLIGSSIVLLRTKAYETAHRIAIGAFFIALLAAIGYLYGVAYLIGIGRFFPMALNTSLAIMCLSLAILNLEPTKGLTAIAASDSAGGVIARRLIPMGLFLPILCGYARVIGVRYGWFSEDLGLAIVVVAGVIVSTLIMWHEINVIHAVATALSEEKARAEALLGSIGEGLIASDDKARILLMNESAHRMLGWTAAEMVGREIGAEFPRMEDVHFKPVPLARRPFHRALKTGETVVIDITSREQFYYVRKDGSRFPVAVTATPIVLDGNRAGVISVFRDITEAREFDNAKADFIALASHQLKTPPTAIKWDADILLQKSTGPLNARQEQAARNIAEVSAHMIDTVNALLDVSRLETGTFSVNPEPTDYAAVAKDVIKDVKDQSEWKRLTVNEEYAADIPTVPADPALAKIIIENLVSNAVKYTPMGGTIDVSVAHRRRPKMVRITVKDTGIGIPARQQPSIFGKMFRADNVRGAMEGTGLGLYLVKAIVEFAGGTVRFTSEEGYGSTFIVDLPTKGMTLKEGTSRLERVR